MKNKKKNENYLNYIPYKNEKIQWKKTDRGIVQLEIKRDGIADKIVRKFFKTPHKMLLDMDELGSFVWNVIDGNRDIYEISLLVSDKFGEKAEPIYNRLAAYINILKNNNFIELKRR